MDRPYSNLADNGMLGGLSSLLEGYYGQQAQIAQLAEDCLAYVDAIRDIPTMDDSRCVIYAGMWCPTSHYVVRHFLQNRADRYNLRSLKTLRNLFYDQYAYAADCAEYLAGYANRAETTYQYVAAIDLTSKYGVPVYGEAGNGR